VIVNTIINTDNLNFSYNKREKILKSLSIEIEEGAIFGFVGPNGAGKTTTIKIIATLLQADGGQVRVGGYDVRRDKESVRKLLGYVPDFFGLYNDMSVHEYLDFFAGCYYIPLSARPALIGDLLALVDLDHRRDDVLNGLSRGMKQRLGLARALIHDPQILVLDEPASGLDPRARVEFRALLRELQRMGKTILFSSHILADVDELCTEVGIIEAGKMVAVDNLTTLRTQLNQHRVIYFTLIGDTVDAALAVLSYVPEVSDVTYSQNADGDWDVRLSFSGDKMGVSALVARLVQADIPLLSFREESESLEEMFMQLTEGIVS